jgi:trimeric autotransporter adhesin
MSILDRSQSRWGLGRVGGRRGGQRRRPRGLVGMEILEARVVLSSSWTGHDAANSTNWSDAMNWSPEVAPVAGDDIVFPTGASSLTSNNDLTAGTTFGSLTIGDTGYSITGNAATFTSIDASQGSGSSEVELPITLSGAVAVDHAGAKLVLGGVISGSAGLSKSGPGVLNLTAANSYTGTTAITGGVLLVDGAQGGSPVSVALTATLGGNGTVGAITANGGTVSPGDSAAGVLIDTGSFNLGQDASSNNSSYSVVIDGSTPGTGSGHYSQTQVSGAINLTGATLNVTLGQDFTPSVPTSFTIIDNTSSLPVAGTFIGQPQGSTLDVDGSTFQIDYHGGSAGNSVVLTEVFPSATSLIATSSTSVFGQSVGLTATVAGPSGDPTPTGTVNFFNGTTLLGTGTLSSGTFTLNTTLLPVATNSITAQYQGDSNYGTSTSPASTVTVSAASTSVGLTASPVSPLVGQSVTFTATVTVTSPGTGSPTGTVNFMDGQTLLGPGTLANGVATFQTSTLTATTHTITADYVSDGNYLASSSSPLTLTVAATPTTTTTVTPSTTTPVFGQQVAFSITVAPISPATGTPTGTVEILNGGTLLDTETLSGGTANFQTNSLALGSNTITVVYSGDDTFTSSTSTPLTLTVGLAGSAAVVTSFPSKPVVGQTVALTATVSAASPGAGTPTGTVQFFKGTTSIGTATLSGGVATISTSALTVGANSITAQYLGDTDFNGVTSPAVTVTLAQTPTSATTLSFSPNSPVFGQNVSLIATVSSTTTGTPSGSVQFFNGTTSLGTATLTGNTATLPPVSLPTGANSITAQYSGDPTFTSSTSPVTTVTVGMATTTTTVTFTPSAPVFGQSVTLTATITSTTTGSTPPSGTVIFHSGSTTLGSGTIANGVATISTTILSVGADSVTAQYQGDTNYATSTSAPVSVPVSKASTTTVLTFFPSSPVANQNVTLTATVAPVSPGAGQLSGTVEFFNGTTSLGTATITAGVATLRTTALPSGTNSVTAQYSGDTNFAGNTSPAVPVAVAAIATSTTTVTFSPSAPVDGQSVTLTATVGPVSPLTGTPTGLVKFFNGTTLLGSGTLTNGVGTFSTTTLPVGNNSITAQYSGDGTFTSSTSAPVVVPVIEISTTTILTFTPSLPAFGTSVTFTATITPASIGTAAPTGTVNFFSGTTMIGSGTVSNDVATFTTTTLPVGTSSITATYVGDSKYLGSTSTPATVVTVSQQTTTTTVTFSPALPVSEQVVTLTATITPSATGAVTPTGTVDFFNGSTLLGTGTVSNNVASLNTTGLTVGNNALTAQYLGDANYAGSTSAVNSMAVVLAATTTTVSASNASPAPFEAVTLTAVVAVNSPGAGTASGTVQFFADGTSLGTATLSGGQASLSVVLPIAVNSITAQYSGSSVLESSASTPVTVAVGTPNEQWLNAVYLLEVGRAPTQAELTRGVNQLAKGVSRKKVVNGIANSPEASAFLVQSDFELYLGVTPTSKQVNKTIKEAQSTHTSVLAVILGSQTFFEESGGSLEGFLASLETAVLGAPTQEFGLRFQLQEGVSRTKVANDLLTSNVGKLSLVSPNFVAVLNRAPTRAEEGNFVALMSRGNFLRNIIASLLAGNEFYKNSTT